MAKSINKKQRNDIASYFVANTLHQALPEFEKILSSMNIQIPKGEFNNIAPSTVMNEPAIQIIIGNYVRRTLEKLVQENRK